jgi:hypothetical protein
MIWSRTSRRPLPAIMAQALLVTAMLAPAASAASPIHPLAVRYAHPLVERAVLASDPRRPGVAKKGGEPK